MLTVFGDHLLLDGDPIASIAHLSPSVRMRLTDAVTAPFIDFGTAVISKVVLNDSGDIVNAYPDHKHEPALPDNHSVDEVVLLSEIHAMLDAAGVEWE